MITCGACGTENPDSEEFCQSCGRFLEYTLRPDPSQPAARPPQRPAPPEPGPQTLREPVITLASPPGPATPGESLVLVARVRNASTVVDRVSLTIVGRSAAWWKVEPASVSLYPGTEAEVRLEFRPPKGPDLPAGPTPVGLRAQTDPPDVRMATAEFQVDVAPFTALTSELVPRTSRGIRTGRHTVSLANGGNATWNGTVRAVDPDARLNLKVAPESPAVPPGGRSTVTVTAGGRGFNYVGQADVRPFTIEVRPADGGALVSHEARFEQSSLFRVFPTGILLGLLAAILVVVAVMAGWIKLPPEATPTPSVSTTIEPSATSDETPPTVPPSETAEVTPEITPEDTATPPAVADWAQQWADELGLGAPIGVTVPVDDGEGQFQAFEEGVVYLRPDGTAWPMRGDILGKWGCLMVGGEGVGCIPPGDVKPLIIPELGYPADQEQVDAAGEPFQRFDRGGIYCYQGCGSIVYEPLDPVWQTLSAALGTPIKDQIQTDQFNDAYLGRFVNGFLLVAPNGTDWIACGYEGQLISSSGLQSDCFGWAAYVKSLPE
jgi:hypothetical protein